MSLFFFSLFLSVPIFCLRACVCTRWGVRCAFGRWGLETRRINLWSHRCIAYSCLCTTPNIVLRRFVRAKTRFLPEQRWTVSSSPCSKVVSFYLLLRESLHARETWPYRRVEHRNRTSLNAMEQWVKMSLRKIFRRRRAPGFEWNPFNSTGITATKKEDHERNTYELIVEISPWGRRNLLLLFL